MRASDIYAVGTNGGASDDTQATSSPLSPDRSTSPQSQGAPAPSGAMSHAGAISWVGLLIALVLLRVIYEFSE